MLELVLPALLGLPVVLAQDQSMTCCQALQEAGLSNVLFPGNVEYQAREASYWSVSAQLEPECIVQPTSTEDVVQVVNTLVKGDACSETQFALRGGGHTTWAGSNNIDNGVTVDFGLMNSTTLDDSTNVASIQPGSRWGQVYATLDPMGYTVAGGRAASVGVAGFLTGGGNSFFSARMGFACDTVTNFEVVLASGEVINANAEENSDLYTTLKGGSGSNYGIVTRFDMQAFEAGNLWGGTATYNKSTGQQHLEAYVDWTDKVNDYPAGSSIIFWTYQPSLSEIVILAAYEDTEGNEAPASFDKFLAIESTADTLRMDTHKALTDELEQPAGYRDIWFTMAFANDLQIYEKIVELHEQFVEEWKAESSDPDFITQCMFQSIPTIFSERSAETGGNVMGLDLVNENVVMLLLNIAVKGADLEVQGREKLRSYGEQMREFASSVDGLVNWQYLNYADYYQDPLGSYGADNVAKMREASTKYDPERIFQTKSPGGFKISKVDGDTNASSIMLDVELDVDLPPVEANLSDA